MSTEIRNDELIISVPNSEAQIHCQRSCIKPRTVSSYYLSNKYDEAFRFFNGFAGIFVLDLSMSYLLCKGPFERLMRNCGTLYRDGCAATKRSLDIIEWAIRDNSSSLLTRIEPPSPSGKGNKYLKIAGAEERISVFKNLCLGDVSEIVFKKISKDVFVLFCRPRLGIEQSFSSPQDLEQWIKENAI